MYVAIPAQTQTPINYISLFSGGGGLDLALKIALPNSRCVCYVENEITAVEILAARIAEGSLDDAPIWSAGISQSQGSKRESPTESTAGCGESTPRSFARFNQTGSFGCGLPFGNPLTKGILKLNGVSDAELKEIEELAKGKP